MQTRRGGQRNSIPTFYWPELLQVNLKTTSPQICPASLLVADPEGSDPQLLHGPRQGGELVTHTLCRLVGIGVELEVEVELKDVNVNLGMESCRP